jgi:hypothetical protein
MNDLRFVIFSIVIYYDTKMGLNAILCKYFAQINTTLTKNLVLRRKAEKSPATLQRRARVGYLKGLIFLVWQLAK